MLVIAMRRFTPGLPGTAEIRVAAPLDEVETERFDGADVVVEPGVGVPALEVAVAVAVEEDDGGGEGVVVVDYVGEVGH